MNQKNSRRQFLKGAAGGLGGMIAARVAGFFPEAEPILAQAARETIPVSRPVNSTHVDVGELYAGFLLLPDGAPLPDFVAPSVFGAPIMCSVGMGGPRPTAISESFNTADELANSIDISVYTFRPTPERLRPIGANLVKHETGELYMTSVDFQSFNEQVGEWETAVYISGYPDAPFPFPLWSTASVELDGPVTVLEKVDYLPSPGILVATQRGHILHWIEHKVLFTLVVEHTKSRDAIQPLINSLALVK